MSVALQASRKQTNAAMLRASTIVRVFVLFSLFLCLTAIVESQTAATVGSSAREIPSEIAKVESHVDQVIERAEAYFKNGKMNLADNKRESARADFDRAIDEILTSGFDVRASHKLEAFYFELVERIYREEVPLAQQRTTATPVVPGSATATSTPIIGFRARGFDPSPLDPLSKLVVLPQDKPSEDQNATKYRARKGDTIAKIAAARGLPVDELSRLNGIAANTELQAGQEIRLPIIPTELGSLRSEYVKSTQDYKASLQKLLTNKAKRKRKIV
jgi:LysM repeat protein